MAGAAGHVIAEPGDGLGGLCVRGDVLYSRIDLAITVYAACSSPGSARRGSSSRKVGGSWGDVSPDLQRMFTTQTRAYSNLLDFTMSGFAPPRIKP